MNFSNPKPIKINPPAGKAGQQNPLSVVFEKAWAGLSMVALMVPGANTKQNLPAKNIGILIFILIVAYLGGCGVYLNIKWLRHVEFSGEWFYYAGVSVALWIAIEFFNLEKKLREFAIEKKLIYGNHNSPLEDLIGRNKLYNIYSSLMEAVSFFWVVIGIFAFERTKFIILFAVLVIFSLITSKLKKIEHAKILFIVESISALAIILFILLNHFLL